MPPKHPPPNARFRLGVAATLRGTANRLRLTLRKPANRALLALCVAILFAGVVVVGRTVSEREATRMEDEYAAVPSPNFDSRPFLMPVDCVVLHATVTETADQAIQVFLEPRSHVSAHFVVARSGHVTQMVPLGRRAWHAGKSHLGGRANVNNFSVGIEIVNRNDGRQLYTGAQYRAVAGIIRHLRAARGFQVGPERIISHRAIALPKGRKSDPRGFDFARLNALLVAR